MQYPLLSQRIYRSLNLHNESLQRRHYRTHQCEQNPFKSRSKPLGRLQQNSHTSATPLRSSQFSAMLSHMRYTKWQWRSLKLSGAFHLNSIHTGASSMGQHQTSPEMIWINARPRDHRWRFTWEKLPQWTCWRVNTFMICECFCATWMRQPQERQTESSVGGEEWTSSHQPSLAFALSCSNVFWSGWIKSHCRTPRQKKHQNSVVCWTGVC